MDSTGLVTSVAAGTATITVTYHNVSDTRTVTVQAASKPIYKWWYSSTDGTSKTYISFSSGSAEVDILQGYATTIGIEKWTNDTTQSTTNDTYTFNVQNNPGTSYMTYTTNSTSITIHNKQAYNSGYVYVYATPSSTGTQESNYVYIYLKGAF